MRRPIQQIQIIIIYQVRSIKYFIRLLIYLSFWLVINLVFLFPHIQQIYRPSCCPLNSLFLIFWIEFKDLVLFLFPGKRIIGPFVEFFVLICWTFSKYLRLQQILVGVLILLLLVIIHYIISHERLFLTFIEKDRVFFWRYSSGNKTVH